MQKVRTLRVTIAGRAFVLDAAAIERAMRGVEPELLRDHAVVVGNRRFPPKQVINRVTGVDRADFTTNQARAILRRLGFAVSRIGARTAEAVIPYKPSDTRWGEREAERLKPFRGQWVVLKDGEVIASGDDPVELVGRLRRSGQKGDSLFRVPIDASVDMGGFPGA